MVALNENLLHEQRWMAWASADVDENTGNINAETKILPWPWQEKQNQVMTTQ